MNCFGTRGSVVWGEDITCLDETLFVLGLSSNKTYFGFINVSGGPQVCHEFLISGSNKIPDNKLTATSTWSNSSNQDGKPYRARLFNSGYNFGNGTYLVGGWVAGVNDKNQYIQVKITEILSSNPFLKYETRVSWNLNYRACDRYDIGTFILFNVP